MGRLDLRLAEILHPRRCYVSIAKKDAPGAVVEYHLDSWYVKKIESMPFEKIGQLAKKTETMDLEEFVTVKDYRNGPG